MRQSTVFLIVSLPLTLLFSQINSRKFWTEDEPFFPKILQNEHPIYKQSIYQEINRKGNGDQSFLIIVNEELYPNITTSLETYQTDLTNEGYSPVVVSFNGSGCFEVKEILKDYYQNDQIIGAILIGDIPLPWYKMTDLWETYPSSFSCNHYYSDLDGFWGFHEEGYLNVHSGLMEPDIMLGRIKADNLPMIGKSEVDLINDYFARNHAFRTATITNEKALVYIDDYWTVDGPKRLDYMSYLYRDAELVNEPNTTRAVDYKERLQSSYQFIQISAHSSGKFHQFTYNKSHYERLYNYDLPVINPTPCFYNLGACKAANLYLDNNLGSMYLFSNNSALGVIASTKTGHMEKSEDFYKALSENKCIGEALKIWWSNNVDTGLFTEWERSWYYGVLLLGDPTLIVKKGFTLGELTIVDEDGDGFMGAGETINLSVTLIHPEVEVESIQGVLTNTQPGVSIIQGETIFQSLGNNQIQNTTPLNIQIADTLKNNTFFYLKISLENYNTVQIPCTTKAPIIDVIDYKISPSQDPQYDYFLKFILTNNGETNGQNITMNVDGLSSVTFDALSYVKSEFSVNSLDSVSVKCKVHQSPGVIQVTMAGDNFHDTGKYLFGISDFDTTFTMDGAGLFQTYPVREGYENEWRHSNSDGREGGCYQYGMRTRDYKSFADGALETPFFRIGDAASFSFWMRYAFDTLWDGLYVEAYQKGRWSHLNIIGGYPSYVTNELMEEHLKVPAFSSIDYSWKLYELDLSNMSGFAKFRFRVVGDGDYEDVGCSLDDLRVIVGTNSTGIHEGKIETPQSIILYHNFPNPFNGCTQIQFHVFEKTQTTVEIYNILGEKVAVLMNQMLESGEHYIIWNGENSTHEEVSGGIYIIRLTFKNKTDFWQRSIKVLFVK